MKKNRKKYLGLLLLAAVMVLGSLPVVHAADYAYCYLGEARMMGETDHCSSYGWGTTYLYLNNSYDSEVAVELVILYKIEIGGQIVDYLYESAYASAEYDVDITCEPGNYMRDFTTEVVGAESIHTGRYINASDSLYTSSGITSY